MTEVADAVVMAAMGETFTQARRRLAKRTKIVAEANPYHDRQGRFATGGVGGTTAPHPGPIGQPPLTGAAAITKVREKAWSGATEATKTKLTFTQAGAIGERVVLAHLQAQGHRDAHPMNLERPNYPVDLAYDHRAVEVKAGKVSNGRSAQQWRATEGEPGKATRVWLRTATAAQKAEYHRTMAGRIMERKLAAAKKLNAQGRTMTVILHPDKKLADVYQFEGFHARISWSNAKDHYVATYRYE
jgi:hypothetical protein